MRIISGLVLGLAGMAIIGLYTVVNRRSRNRGSLANWIRGWLLAVPGMGSTAVGWALLATSAPKVFVPALSIAGWVLCASGATLYLMSAFAVGRMRPPSRYSLGLYTGGIYRWVRHPQALALCVLAVGVALASGSIPYVLSLPIWLGGWVVYTYLEERCELLPAFGDEYRAYRQRTPRLVPGLQVFQRVARARRSRKRPGASHTRRGKRRRAWPLGARKTG